MKIKPSLITILLLGTTALFAQTYPEKTTQQVAIGPYIGYESSLEAVVYGLEGLYEFRPFRRWGFTASATYDQSPYTTFDPYYFFSDFVKSLLEIPNTANNIKLKQSRFAIAGGSRFYIKRFFIAGGIGWTTIDFMLKDDEQNETVDGDDQKFYHYYGAGYQLPLKNKQQQLEFFFQGTTGGVPHTNGTPKVVAGIKYGLKLR